jgi:hypothetical protein
MFKMLNETSHPKIALREPAASLPMRKNKAAGAVHTDPTIQFDLAAEETRSRR